MASRFYDVLTAAVSDISEHGFDSIERIEHWMELIGKSAEAALPAERIMEKRLRAELGAIYRKMVDKDGILKLNPGVDRFTVRELRPKLRAELERRIVASADLIKLNRRATIQKTLQRFSGWASSVPKGGSGFVDKAKTKIDIRKALAQLPFEDRRVLIDQGHKFTSSLSEIIAHDAGAIAAEWHSNWRQANYDYREDHKERDGNIYAVRGCWALDQSLMKPGPAGYTDEITKPAEEIFCRCAYRFIYNLRDLPANMLTAKGRGALKEFRVSA